MSLRHRPLRSSITTIAVAGAAALATVLSSAPALADDVAPTEGADSTTSSGEADDTTVEPAPEPADDTVSDEDSAPADPEDGEVLPEEPQATDSEAPEPEVAPEAVTDEKKSVVSPLKAAAEAADDVVADFGYEKFRVGVQVADGSFVPEGGTVGSVFSITITDDEGESVTRECITQVPQDDDLGTSFCDGNFGIPDTGAPDEARSARSVTIEPSPTTDNTFDLGGAETATIVQTSAVEGLEPSTTTVVLGPCSDDPEPEGCTTNSFPPDSADVIFENVGTPPDAVDDAATTDQGDAVDIDLLANDDPSIAPITGVALDSEVANGTVEIDDAGVATYTPDADFSGTETFTYALSTQNGSDAATVTVEVEGDEIAPAADEVTPAPTAAPVSSALPDTGGPDASLLGYAALLLAGGGWLTARARRRTAADRG